MGTFRPRHRICSIGGGGSGTVNCHGNGRPTNCLSDMQPSNQLTGSLTGQAIIIIKSIRDTNSHISHSPEAGIKTIN